MLTQYDRHQLRRIQIRARRSVHTQFAGAYRSTFRSRGLMFDSVRPYQYGDDVRDIDWNVSARTGEPHSRLYVAEREQVLMIVLDGSASLLFGTAERSKREAAAELAAILALCADAHQDRVGLMIFTDRVEHYVPPRRGRSHLMRVLHDIWTFKPHSSATALVPVLSVLERVLRSHSIVLLVSDFMLPPTSYERDLLALGHHHDVNALCVTDALEQSMPAVGIMAVQDAESRRLTLVDTAARGAHQSFQQAAARHLADRDALFRRAGVAQWDFPFVGDVASALRAFFHMKQRMRRP